MSGSGWGGAGYGSGGWGGPATTPLSLLSAVAVGENVVQLTFSGPVYFSGLLDAPDGSSRKRYQITPVAGSTGMDGTAAKPIGVAAAAVAMVPGLLVGQVVNLTTDRPMTPNPARYSIECNGLFAADRVTPLSASANTAPFTSVFKVLQPPQQETLSPRGDIAMPQSLEAIQTGGVEPSGVSLGSFVVANGDYATQGGLVEYKERCYRRIYTKRDGFLHLAGKKYGAGLLGYGKALGTAAKRAELQGHIEQQVGMEPETAAVSCKTVPKPGNPGEMYMVLLARTKFGTPLKIAAPFNTST
jgi:hypothetical protein